MTTKELDFLIDIRKEISLVWVSKRDFDCFVREAKESDVNVKAIARLGYMSVIYRGIPILWDEAIAPGLALTLEPGLIEAIGNTE